jgi:hypothetical protein
MRWKRTIVLFNKGSVMESDDWRAVHESYVRSIESIDFPVSSGSLTLRRKVRLPNGQWRRNGVGYLRQRFLDHIVAVEGWQAEGDPNLAQGSGVEVTLYPSSTSDVEPITSDFGGFDLVTTGPEGARIAIEWETGNVSSSHRSMNKLAIALEMGAVDAGVLIVPSRALYEHLTDRIGNISELSGYLRMWQSLGRSIDRGLLAITVVEHDHLTDAQDFEYLPTGNDGRAAEGRART